MPNDCQKSDLDEIRNQQLPACYRRVTVTRLIPAHVENGLRIRNASLKAETHIALGANKPISKILGPKRT